MSKQKTKEPKIYYLIPIIVIVVCLISGYFLQDHFLKQDFMSKPHIVAGGLYSEDSGINGYCSQLKGNLSCEYVNEAVINHPCDERVIKYGETVVIKYGIENGLAQYVKSDGCNVMNVITYNQTGQVISVSEKNCTVTVGFRKDTGENCYDLAQTENIPRFYDKTCRCTYDQRNEVSVIESLNGNPSCLWWGNCLGG